MAQLTCGEAGHLPCFQRPYLLFLSVILYYSTDSNKFWSWIQIRFSQILSRLGAGCQGSVSFVIQSKAMMLKIITGDFSIAGSL